MYIYIYKLRYIVELILSMQSIKFSHFLKTHLHKSCILHLQENSVLVVKFSLLNCDYF